MCKRKDIASHLFFHLDFTFDAADCYSEPLVDLNVKTRGRIRFLSLHSHCAKCLVSTRAALPQASDGSEKAAFEY